ncbi:MAG: hypothetical protein EP332_11945 [Bacteroidetes bacterium]|nr:MAG: hypothetical protein EP332_11945 [Bacteroidota bacterium]
MIQDSEKQTDTVNSKSETSYEDSFDSRFSIAYPEEIEFPELSDWSAFEYYEGEEYLTNLFMWPNYANHFDVDSGVEYELQVFTRNKTLNQNHLKLIQSLPRLDTSFFNHLKDAFAQDFHRLFPSENLKPEEVMKQLTLKTIQVGSEGELVLEFYADYDEEHGKSALIIDKRVQEIRGIAEFTME